MLLINKIFRNTYSKQLRNLLSIKPSFDIIDYTSQGLSVSDAFFWRTDNSYETIFKFTNILKYFFNETSSNIKILFFSKNNKFIKEKNISIKKNLSQININKSFLNNLESYGVFYIFHETDNKIKSIVRNSCYTGYSWKKNLPSMVHGNTVVAKKKFDKQNIEYGIGGYSLLRKISYTIQNNLDAQETEMMLVNPTNIQISFKVNDKNFKLKKGCSELITIDKNKLITINSNCYLLRPIIFERTNDFINVYHG